MRLQDYFTVGCGRRSRGFVDAAEVRTDKRLQGPTKWKLKHCIRSSWVLLEGILQIEESRRFSF